MSRAVSPSPRPLSASLLLADTSAHADGPESASARSTLSATGISLWFGGQSVAGFAEHVRVGAVLSTSTAGDRNVAWLPARSTTVTSAVRARPSPPTTSGLVGVVDSTPDTASWPANAKVTLPLFQPATPTCPLVV